MFSYYLRATLSFNILLLDNINWFYIYQNFRQKEKLIQIITIFNELNTLANITEENSTSTCKSLILDKYNEILVVYDTFTSRFIMLDCSNKKTYHSRNKNDRNFFTCLNFQNWKHVRGPSTVMIISATKMWQYRERNVKTTLSVGLLEMMPNHGAIQTIKTLDGTPVTCLNVVSTTIGTGKK